MIKTKKYLASQISNIVNGELIGKDCLIEFISMDSREMSLINSCFFALPGEKYTGEIYINEAIEKGAQLIVTSQKAAKKKASIIFVEDVKLALLKLAAYNKGDTKIVGITGSNGKTTVKEMIKSVLKQKYRVSATDLNHNNEIGVAQTLLSITNEEYCVLEMGMRALGEIDLLSKISTPYISIITNVGTAHMERLGSAQNVFLAKCEILNNTKKYAVIPSEERFKKLNYTQITPIFIGANGDIVLGNLSYDQNGIDFEIKDNNFNEKYKFFINSYSHNDCKNAMCAYCVGRLCNVPVEAIYKGIAEFKNCENRGHIYKIKDITIIDDCYNASYESMRNAIIVLSKYSYLHEKRAYAILGDMLEIGYDSKKYHLEIGRMARKYGIINIFSVGEYAEEYCRGFDGGIPFASKEMLENYIYEHYENKDVFLVKASRKAHFETIIEGLKERLNEN